MKLLSTLNKGYFKCLHEVKYSQNITILQELQWLYCGETQLT